MSRWTYVNGLIRVSSLGANSQADSDYAVAKVVENLPKVTGSERDMAVTIVPIDEATSSNWDCALKKDTELREEYYLVVHGDLRDREFEQTFREFNKFMNRLAKRIWVLDTLVEVNTWNRSYVFKDHHFYGTLTD